MGFYIIGGQAAEEVMNTAEIIEETSAVRDCVHAWIGLPCDRRTFLALSSLREELAHQALDPP